jgi:small GTP-binding protein
MEETKYSFKCVVLGDSSVGKTSLIMRFVSNTYSSEPESTVGASYLTKTVTHDSSRVKFNIWDTAGQERYRSLIRLYYKDVHVALLVYDITQPHSYRQLKVWLQELIEQCQAKVTVAIVANKEDLVAEEAIDPSEARAYAESIGASYYRTSCKSDTGVAQLFMGITQAFLKKSDSGLADKGIVLQAHKLTSRETIKHKSKCC